MLPGQRWAWKKYEVRSLASEFNDYSIRLIGNWSHVRPFTGSITVICWPYLNQLRRATVRSPVTGELEHARYRVSKRYYASLVVLKFLRSDFFGSFLYLTIVANRFAGSSLPEKSIGQFWQFTSVHFSLETAEILIYHKNRWQLVVLLEPYSAFLQWNHQRPLGIVLLCSLPQSCGTAYHRTQGQPQVYHVSKLNWKRFYFPKFFLDEVLYF